MKVNNPSLDTPLSKGVTGSAKRADGSTSTASSTSDTAAPAGVSVTLSATSRSYTQAAARSGTDVFNAQKVEAMRTAIQNGSFSVNPQAIADKLLSNAREMLRVASAN